MGFDSALQWKKYYEETFRMDSEDSFTTQGEDFFAKIVDGLAIDTPHLLFLFFMCKDVTRWSTLAERFSGKILKWVAEGSAINKIMLAVDDPDNTPANKRIKRDAKEDKVAQRDEFTLTEEDALTSFEIRDEIVPKGLLSYDHEKVKAAMLRVRNFKFRILSWLCKITFTKLVATKRPIDLVMDSILFEFSPITGINHFSNDSHVSIQARMGNMNITGSVKKSGCVGEAELKVVKYINCLPSREKNIIGVYSKDTDMLFILLLSYKHWICTEEKKTKKHILFLDGAKVWNITRLWRRIHVYFRDRYSTFRNNTPIETLTFLAVLCGTDFTTRIPQIGVVKIMKYFHNVGFKYLGELKEANDDDPMEIETFGYGGMLHDARRNTFQGSCKYGDQNSEKMLEINQTEIESFIRGLINSVPASVKKLESELGTKNFQSYIRSTYLKVVWVMNYWKFSILSIDNKPLPIDKFGW